VKALLVLAIFAIPLAAQVVEGRVVNAVTGTAIPGARITLFQNGEPVHRLEADADGGFHFEFVKTGIYEARYTAPHFSPVPALGERLPHVQVRAGEPLHLEIKLQPLAKISGRVTDAAGKPVSKADIWAVSDWSLCKPPACSPFRLHGTANDKGEYTLADIEIDGDWQVAASAPLAYDPPAPSNGQRLGWAQTFYGHASEAQLAAVVPVHAGAEIWNTDIQLLAVPVHRLRGRVLDMGGRAATKVAVSIDGSYGPTFKRETDAEGAFEFPSVTAGDWRISASAQSAVKAWVAESIHMTDRDLDVELRLAEPFSLPGRIVADVPEAVPAPALEPVDVMLISQASSLNDSPRDFALVGAPFGEKEFQVKGVYPGSYMVQPLGGSAGPYYLDSIRIGDRDASGLDVPILSGAQPLVLTYKLGGGSVRGKIEGCGGASVVLVPRDPTLRRNGFFGLGHCGPDGNFQLSAIRPGEYYGLAMTGDRGPSFDEGVLKQAARITVRAGETTTSPDLRILR
jgi:hypothetical protein